MPQFEVTRIDGRYEAKCRELGVVISANDLAAVEATARRTAARAKMQAVFAYKMAPETRLTRLLRWLLPRPPRGR